MVMSDPKPSGSLTSILSRLEITAISLALLSAVLYAHGTVFHRAYLESFGLSDETFPLSVDETMMRGFEAYLLMSARAVEKFVGLGYVIQVMSLLALVALAACAEWIRKRSSVRRVTGQIGRWAYRTPEENERALPTPLLDFVLKFVVLFLLLMFSIVIIIATAGLLAANGRYKAETFRLACDPAIPRDDRLTVFSMSPPLVTVLYEQPGTSEPISARGCVVAAVPELIAVYEKAGTVAIAKARIISIKASPK